MINVRVDQERCQGHGICYGFFPEFFDADSEGYGVVLAAELSDGDRRALVDVADVCPERAVVVEEG
jgi:ferredoxin